MWISKILNSANKPVSRQNSISSVSIEHNPLDMTGNPLSWQRWSLNYRFFVLTGDPGVGKTTLVQKIYSMLNINGIKTVGFYTEEVRKGGSRQGFDVVSLGGQRGRLAVDQTLLSSPSKHKVGKYGVLIKDFEDVAMPCLELPKNNSTCILVIDEIGKMEFFSEPFKSKIREIFSQQSQYLVIATIPVRKSDPLIENIRNDSRAKVWKPKNNSTCILVIDEIGKMEFFSEPFKSKIREIFSQQSQYLVIATIPVRKSDPLIENIRNDSRAKVWKVTRENRNRLLEEIVSEITKTTQV